MCDSKASSEAHALLGYNKFLAKAEWRGNLSDLSFSLNSTSLERHSDTFHQERLHSPSGGCATAC